MKIDTAEKYKALQGRKRRPRRGWKNWHVKDFRDATKDHKSRQQVLIIDGGKPNHQERAMDIQECFPLLRKQITAADLNRLMHR